ncbi:hypothetical protein IED13_25935 [Bosea sp. SSUT16]|uniref:Uncharacterized protein n=1 Tax=Bosea spartocytisi TaxID=2773451 RepID=A0A927EF73_9HYPH|nr:hypothetical protein [Bosea spartocytisi]MBD3849155.1 hypothetical protein [Bosea spartocytisi]MCT4475502.1 hypothetical protein [Bosea spartocytisi]
MRMLPIAMVITVTSFTLPGHASVPTNDAAALTQRSEQSATTIKLVPVTTKRQEANKGVKCAVTTGKKANVTNPTVEPQNGAGAKKIQSYAPEMPATVDPEARGGTLNSQTRFQSTATVVGGVEASHSTIGAARTGYQTASQEVGKADTVMGALDMNSAARTQNDLSWNGLIGSTNLWVTALNAQNLFANSEISRASSGMRAPARQSRPQSGSVCPIGMIGASTTADPCRAPASCQTSQPGATPDPACVSARATDSDGNVLFYLAAIQNAANAAAGAVTAGQ